MIAKRTIQTNVNFPIWNEGLDYGELLVKIHRQDSIYKNKKKSRGRKDYNFPLTVKTANKSDLPPYVQLWLGRFFFATSTTNCSATKDEQQSVGFKPLT